VIVASYGDWQELSINPANHVLRYFLFDANTIEAISASDISLMTFKSLLSSGKVMFLVPTFT
jgi:hypothetical protein